MPKGIITTPRPCCGSRGTRHMKDCKGVGATATKATPTAPATKRAPRHVVDRNLTDLELVGLLKLRREIDGELGRRKDEAEAMLAALKEALAP